MTVRSALQRPIQRLPIRKTVDSVSSQKLVEAKVDVVQMTRWHAVRWQNRVQPWIDQHYRPSGPGVLPAYTRADVGWNWGNILMLAAAHSYVRAQQSGPPVALCVVLFDQNGLEIPVGMLTAVPQYHCNVLGAVRRRSFAWFLADAPAEFYEQSLRTEPVAAVAPALLDCAIQAGYDAGEDGTLLLHADPKGGQKLTDFYRSKCNMSQLPPGGEHVTAVRRGPTEEYFTFDAPAAARFCARFDPRR